MNLISISLTLLYRSKLIMKLIPSPKKEIVLSPISLAYPLSFRKSADLATFFISSSAIIILFITLSYNHFSKECFSSMSMIQVYIYLVLQS